MWQFELMLGLIPESMLLSIYYLLALSGIVLYVGSKFFKIFPFKLIPFLGQYPLLAELVGVFLLVISAWLLGGNSVNEAWKEKAKDIQAQVDAAEEKSKEVNTVVKTKIVKQLELVRTRGDDIIKYVDREVAVDKEVIKFVEKCPIPDIVVKTQNAAALNQPLGEKK